MFRLRRVHQRKIGDVTGSWRTHSLWLIIIAASVLSCYANSCSGPFIADDIPGITKNNDIRSIGSSLRALGDDRQSPLSGRPLVSFTFALNYAASELNVWGYHVVNIILHVVNAFVLYFLVLAVLSNPRWRAAFDHTIAHVAGMTALTWALHPLQTETVDYVVQRTELLVALFYLGGFAAAAIGTVSSRSPRWSIVAVGCALCGVFCKEVIASLPLVILLYDGCFATAGVLHALRKRPWMYVGLFSSWVVLGAVVACAPRGASVGFHHGITPWQYLLTEAGALVLYLRLALWPAALSVSYADWPIAHSIGDAILPGLFVLILLIVCLVATMRRSAAGLLGTTCFLILAPTSSFVPIATEPVAERRMYLPLAAITLLIVICAHALLRKSSGIGHAAARRGLFGISVALALPLAGRTITRNHDYQSALVLWTKTADARPANYVAYCGIGHALLDLDRAKDALDPLEKSVQLKGDYVDGWFHRGRALQRLGRYDEAIESYRRVLDLDPHHYDAMYNLALAMQVSGRLRESVGVYSKLLKEQPGRVRAALNMGVALAALGRDSEAINALRRATNSDPNLVDARFNLAMLLAKQGRLDDAIREYQTVLRDRNGDIEARLALARLLEQKGDLAEAAHQYRMVLSLQPKNVSARQALQHLSK